MFWFLFLIFCIMLYCTAVSMLFSGESLVCSVVFLGFLTYVYWKVISAVIRDLKTGGYQQATTREQIKKKTLEKMRIDNRFDHLENKYTNKHYQKAMKEHAEKWAEPGTESYEEIKRREGAWDRGIRW